ncbi:MAG: hypothetical protein ACTSRG_10910 [Candidatus Helarchaeota archaeon]
MKTFYKIRILSYFISGIFAIISWIIVFSYFGTDTNFEFILQLCWIIITICFLKDIFDFKGKAKNQSNLNKNAKLSKRNLVIEHFPIIFSILIVAIYRLIFNMSEFIAKINNCHDKSFFSSHNLILNFQFVWIYLIMIAFSTIDAYIDFWQDFHFQ